MRSRGPLKNQSKSTGNRVRLTPRKRAATGKRISLKVGPPKATEREDAHREQLCIFDEENFAVCCSSSRKRS